MNWNEIKAELVRRWPEIFETGAGVGSFWVNGERYTEDNLIRSLDAISVICEAIGAVVWSEPRVHDWIALYRSEPTVHDWIALYRTKTPNYVRHGTMTYSHYSTREEAELAALGEWLEATRGE